MSSYLRALELPPPFRLTALREAGDAFVHAVREAPRLGAGSLVLVGRFDLAEFAVVLEPDEPLVQARRSFFAGMVALADTLAGLAPPETPVAIGWPDALEIDGGLVGGGRLGWPADVDEQAVPDWLVFGAVIRLVLPLGDEGGFYPMSTALAEEGFGQPGAEPVAEGFARHFMLALDRLQEGGFAIIARDYLGRLRGANGESWGLDPVGNLRVARAGQSQSSLDLRETLAVPSWLDQAAGGLRR